MQWTNFVICVILGVFLVSKIKGKILTIFKNGITLKTITFYIYFMREVKVECEILYQ